MKFLLLSFVFTYSWASLAFIIPDKYQSGAEVCEKYKSYRIGEIEKRVEVPVDYKDVNGEKTIIYAYTKKTFNKNLPSVIYFTGGPGVSSRNTEFSLPNTNLIFFEQRGVSCSRPNRVELFLDHNFYSSENTAKDALEIIKSYGLKSVVIYGQSYGTIPATIFASFFPKNTSALILEGVIYEGDKSLWNSEIKKNLLQDFYNNLSDEKKERILKLSINNFLPANWFSKLGGMLLYMNDGIDIFKIFLDNVLSMEDENLKSFIQIFYPNDKMEEVFSFGDVMMGMIGCKEISMSNPQLSRTLVFNGNQLVYDQQNEDREYSCRPLHLENWQGPHYQASHYPVRVPTFYLLGENDGATDLDQGKRHFENVAKNKKFMLVMEKGGHLPSLALLKDNRSCDPEIEVDQCQTFKQNNIMVEIFEDIVRNRQINKELISKFNEAGPLIWSENL